MAFNEVNHLAPRLARHRTQRRGATIINQVDAIEAGVLINLLVGATRRVILSRASAAGRLRGLFDSLVEAHGAFGRPIDVDSEAFDRLPIAGRSQLLEALCVSLSGIGRRGVTGLDKRIAWLAQLLELSHGETRIFELIARSELRPEYRVLRPMLYSTENRHDGMDPVAVSLVTGMSLGDVRSVIDPGNRLVRLGLLSERDAYEFNLNSRLKKFFQTNVTSAARMRRALLTVAPPTVLAMADFEHLGGAVGDVLALVQHASRTGRRANILFYGVPGTGKTELARLLAGELGLHAIEVGNADEDGDEPSRSDRLLHLRLCRSLCGASNTGVLVIDEAEDLFAPQGMQTSSKLWLNRLVESGSGAHIWIANSLRELGEPVVRRMDFALRFDTPPAHVQAVIARKATMRRGRAASEPTITRLAAMKTSPSILATAARTAARIGWKEDRLVRISRDLARATGRFSDRKAPRQVIPFDPALSRASHDLSQLSYQLGRSSMPWSMLLYGPPGTGKTAFARHLAAHSGRELIVKTASDLLSCYVGATEGLIAEAFAEAEEADAILLIDEADDFLSDRSRARQQWEASLVNEMLRQMESERARFIATTNRAEVLDPATARRFSVAVEFLSMTEKQAVEMFHTTFGVDAPPHLGQIRDLTPGDFAQAKKRTELLGLESPLTLARWLEEAVANRAVQSPIGF